MTIAESQSPYSTARFVHSLHILMAFCWCACLFSQTQRDFFCFFYFLRCLGSKFFSFLKLLSEAHGAEIIASNL